MSERGTEEEDRKRALEELRRVLVTAREVLVPPNIQSLLALHATPYTPNLDFPSLFGGLPVKVNRLLPPDFAIFVMPDGGHVLMRFKENGTVTLIRLDVPPISLALSVPPFEVEKEEKEFRFKTYLHMFHNDKERK